MRGLITTIRGVVCQYPLIQDKSSVDLDLMEKVIVMYEGKEVIGYVIRPAVVRVKDGWAKDGKYFKGDV